MHCSQAGSSTTLPASGPKYQREPSMTSLIGGIGSGVRSSIVSSIGDFARAQVHHTIDKLFTRPAGEGCSLPCNAALRITAASILDTVSLSDVVNAALTRTSGGTVSVRMKWPERVGLPT